MADPLSVTASVLAIAAAATASIRSLRNIVQSYQDRNKTLRRLQDKLQHLATVLDSLAQVTNADTSVLVLLEGPVDRCREICNEFEQSMKKFHGRSKTGLLDWTKLEFMKGDINDFIDTIESYKSTTMVGLGTINLSVTTPYLSRTLLTSSYQAELQDLRPGVAAVRRDDQRHGIQPRSPLTAD